MQESRRHSFQFLIGKAGVLSSPVKGSARYALLSFFAVSLLTLFALVSCTRSPGRGLGPGQIAPDLQLEDLEGNPVKLSDFRGGVVLLNFWASWCVPCLTEMPDLQKLFKEMKGDGINIVAIAVEDDREKVQELVKRFDLSFPILFDSSGKSKMKYKLTGYPETFFLNEEGQLMLVADPVDSAPVVRIKGPRGWTEPHVFAQLRKLLREESSGKS